MYNLAHVHHWPKKILGKELRKIYVCKNLESLKKLVCVITRVCKVTFGTKGLRMSVVFFNI